MENTKTTYSNPQDTKSGNGLGLNEPVDRAAAGAHKTVDKIANATQHAADAISEKGEKLHDLQDEWLKNVRSYINGHPVQSVGIAIAGGFLLSRILSSR